MKTGFKGLLSQKILRDLTRLPPPPNVVYRIPLLSDMPPGRSNTRLACLARPSSREH